MNEWLLSAAEWWGGTALGGGALLLIGCVLMRLTRDPAARQRVGEVAVIAALLFAVLRLGPAWLQMPWTPAAAHAAPIEASTTLPAELGGWVVITPSTVEPPTWAPEPVAPADAVAAPARSAFEWSTVLTASTATYLAIAGLLLVRWVAGQWALARLRRQSRPASWRSRQLFAEMAAGKVWPEPDLGRTRRLRMPVAFGLSRPAVLMPDSFDRVSDETRLRWVFAHELTHLRRRDPWSYWLLGLAQVVYFYVPWFWSIKRQVRLCQEYVADEAAAREGKAADEYAEFLVSLAKSPAAPLGAAGLGSSSDLFRRVQMVLQLSSRGPASRSQPTSWLAGLGLLTAAVLASGINVRAEPPAREEKDVLIRLDEAEAPQGIFVFEVVDDEVKTEKKKDAQTDEKKKEEKKRVVVMSQDGQIHITIPVDADDKEIQAKVEKAVALARKRAESAKKQAYAARDQARKEVEAAASARKKAASDRGKAEGEREKAASAEKKAQGILLEKAISGSARIAGGRLGLSVESPSAAMADQLDLPKDRGLVVVSVKDESPAAQAGFKANDILVEFAGKSVSSDGNAFAKRVREMKSDEPFDATVLRKGRKERIKGIKLQEAKAPDGEGKFKVWTTEDGKSFGPLKDGKFEFKLDGFPGVDPEKFKGKFEIKLDGLPGAEGAKITDEIKKQIELKLVPLQEKLDPRQFEAIKKEIELKLDMDRSKLKDVRKDLELKLDKDRSKLKDAHKEIELKLDMDRKKIDNLKKELPVKIADIKKGIEVKVVPAVKNVVEGVKIDDVHKHIAVIAADPAKHIEAAKKHIAVIAAEPAKHLEAAKKHIAVIAGDAKVTHGEVVDKIVDISDSADSKKSETSSNVSVSVTVNDGEFKAVQKEDKLEMTVVGSVDGKKVKLEEVRIYDGGFKGTYSTLDKVPEKYRAKVKKLISNQEGSPVRFEFKKD